MSPGFVFIDLDALARNYGRLRDAAGEAECAAVVKANAYGLGIEPVARRLSAEGCRDFFVATLGEGIELRALLPDARIYVLDGAPAGDEQALAGASLIPVINTLAQARAWASSNAPAVLHVDTGMTRLGLSEAEVDALAKEPALLDALSLEYLMTHLACADEPEHALNAEQAERFARVRAKLPPVPVSIGNAAGLLLGGALRGDLVRPGIALYGGNPFSGRPSLVEPVVTLKGAVLQLRSIEVPCTVGYGATYAVSPPATIAVIGVGYADGYPRHLSNAGVASVNGVRVPVIGRVSMDLLCLDVTEVADGVEVGQLVELYGNEISIDEVAEAAGTISYELLTRLGPRLVREYIGGGGT